MISNFFNQTKPIKLRFRRFEFKYQLPPFLADKITADLMDYMNWDPYVSGQPNNAYQVNSLYFDTAGLACYHEKLAGLKDRRKLRLRTYGTDLKPETPVFLEIKRKSDMVILKDRLITDYQKCQGLFNGQFVDFINSQALGQNQELLNEFLWLKKYNCLLPKVMVIYQRKPLFSRIDPGFRITFDSQLKAYPANQLFFSEKAIEVFPQREIMELKYNNTVPVWFHRIIQKYQLERRPFSKYCQSLEVCQRNHLYV